MFTRQVNQLDALLSAGADPVLVDCLRGIIGNCQAALVHRGQVAIETSRVVGATDGALEVSNFNSVGEDIYTIAPSNGKALWVKAGLSQFDGPVRGAFMWAKATGNHTLGSAGPSRDSTVTCSLCSDSAGTLVSPTRSLTVYLPRTQTQDPNVRTGDVIALFIDRNGYAHCVDDVMDGKIGEVRSLVSGTPGDYASGLRGWYLMDGTDGTVNAGGGIEYGYSGAGAFTTVGAAVSASFVFSGSGTASLTISAHAAATSDGTTFNSGNTVVASHSFTFTTAFTGNTATSETSTPCLNTVMGSGSSPVTLDHAAHFHTITQGDVRSSLASHTGTVAITDVASGLSLTTGRPAGYVALKIQRID